MCIELKVRDDLSVNDLLRIARDRPVVRTPHVGNACLRDLFAARCGFRILWVDNTIPTVDRNANPHLLIRNGNPHALAAGPHLSVTLTSHVLVGRDGSEHAGFVRGEPLVNGHLARMRELFPDTRIEPASEHYRRHEETCDAVFEAATDALPHAWYREVDETGRIVRQLRKGEPNGINGWQDIRVHWHKGLGTSGWVLPNLFAILHDLVAQSQEAGAPEVWMLSGPDMIEYLPLQLADLRIAYAAVARRLGLYPDLTVHLVPFAHFKLVVRSVQAEGLDEALCRLERGHALPDLRVLCPDLFKKTAQRQYPSQHDLMSADGLYVPAMLTERPLAEVQEIWTRLTA